ncbi:MAG: IclR family transcriptional regulator [Rhizobiales bacterium]|nr:IclR family transcriptional regulator [Hyphomicrobiales bacterium]
MTSDIVKRPRGRPKQTYEFRPPKTIKALDRGLQILHQLSVEGSSNLSDLALKVGVPTSSTHRTLATLAKHGFVGFNESNQKWFVGVEAFRVGSAFLLQTNLVEVAQDVLRELVSDTGETANLAIVDQENVVFISQVEATKPVRACFASGHRGLMHASGIGKIFLAHMDEKELNKVLKKTGLPTYTPKTLNTQDMLISDLKLIRQRGWSLDNEERYDGMSCIASAVYNSFGEIIAGISVSGPSVGFNGQTIEEIGACVKKSAAQLTTKMGGNINGSVANNESLI